MRILCFGDIHARSNNPRYRVDQYWQTLLNKIEFGLNLGLVNNCEYVAMPGDVFETHRVSNAVISKMIDTMLKYGYLNMTFLGVVGNHDAPFHNLKLENCPLNVLQSAQVLEILDKNPYNANTASDGKINFYGASWGQPIPDIKDKNAFNILLIHKMIIGEDKIWEGQEHYVNARTLLAKNDFDLIISGDNHNCFTSEYSKKVLLNMGSLGRMTAGQLEHKPKVAIYDTSNRTYELFEVPIQPSSVVFNLDEIRHKKQIAEENAKIKEYVSFLSSNEEKQDWNYVKNLNNFMFNNDIRDEVKEIVLQTLED